VTSIATPSFLGTHRRLRSLLLVHGAGSGPWVFEGWPACFPGISTVAVDLQTGVEVEHASMKDYVRVLRMAAADQPTPRGLLGWSMGGLVVLMAAWRLQPACVVVLEPSPPAEIQGFNSSATLSHGTFDPEEVYGAFPPGTRARPESALARGERKRGISVPALPCPSLVVFGKDFAEERGRRVSALYGSQELSFPRLDHWGLVREPRVAQSIAEILAS
jgi:pimeloyl-ACP methyl ester carboxylesterase